MAGHDNGSQYQFTGMAKHFNSFTVRGRANCVMATHACVATIYIIYKLTHKKKPDVTEK